MQEKVAGIGLRVALTVYACAIALQSSSGQDQVGSSARETPAVQLIAKVRKSVLPVFSQTGQQQLGIGSGTVIDAEGFVLTADHVVRGNEGVVLFGLERVDYEVVGRQPERDLTILRVDPKHVQAVTKLGRSNDLQAGEPILIGGNPAGRGIVFSQGTINTPLIDPSWPNVLVKSFWRNDLQDAELRKAITTGGRPEFIQFDAVSNPGNSGGPMLSFDGELVGLVVTKSLIEQGINWAIPADQIRLLMPYIVQPEEVGDFEVGIEIDMLATTPTVLRVINGSPAERCGLQVGDVLRRVNGKQLRDSVSWLFALWDNRQAEKLDLEITRGQATKQLTLVDLRRKTTPSEPAKDMLASGLTYKLYKGRYPVIPDFSKLQPRKHGRVEGVTSAGLVEANESEFAIVFSGFIQLSEPGLYRFTLNSDDGSKLFLNDRLLIDNDLPHPDQKLSRLARVHSNLTPIRIEYAETAGAKSIGLQVFKDVEGAQPVPAVFFCEKTE